jgi:uncharacterized membrane protein (DUF4010 family)
MRRTHIVIIAIKASSFRVYLLVSIEGYHGFPTMKLFQEEANLAG